MTKTNSNNPDMRMSSKRALWYAIFIGGLSTVAVYGAFLYRGEARASAWPIYLVIACITFSLLVFLLYRRFRNESDQFAGPTFFGEHRALGIMYSIGVILFLAEGLTNQHGWRLALRLTAGVYMALSAVLDFRQASRLKQSAPTNAN